MPLVTITPFLATLVAIAWLGEKPDVAVWLAIFFVTAGCLFLTVKPKGIPTGGGFTWSTLFCTPS